VPLNDGAPADVGVKDAGADAPIDALSSATTVIVHYPLASGQTLALRGSAGSLNWTTGAILTSAGANAWQWSSSNLLTSVEVKPLLDDAEWSRGPNYIITPGKTTHLYPHFKASKGAVTTRWLAFASKMLSNTRPVYVYLPAPYAENTEARFPVVYMHDGQNLFDPNLAFGGNEWKADETMDEGVEKGTIREAIIVGIGNTSARMSEYTPVNDPDYGGGGGDKYLEMIEKELKPTVDAELRTMNGREDTAILGSSLGGLISAYAGIGHAGTFGLVGAMSPSTWWNNVWLVGKVATTPASPRPVRVYVDSGDGGSSKDGVDNTKKLADAYRALGYKDDATLKYVMQAGGQHNELYWAERLPGALAFILGPGR
jgi:predicted alpha/beta superfamily hydrolase